MPASAVYILDLKGKVSGSSASRPSSSWLVSTMVSLSPQPLISRDYRGDIDLGVIDKFLPLVMDNEEEGSLSPIVIHEKVTFVYIKHKNLYRIYLTLSLCTTTAQTKYLLCQHTHTHTHNAGGTLNSSPVVASTIKNANVALIFSFLHKIVEVHIKQLSHTHSLTHQSIGHHQYRYSKSTSRN